MSAQERLTDALYGAGWATVKKLPEPVAVRLGRTIADLAWKQRGKGVQRLESNYARVVPDASPERLATVLTYGDLELDREKRRVARSGRQIDLGPTEYRLLEFFLEHPGRVFSREQLLDSVWGRDIYIDERTVDVHIGRLRKLLNPGREQDPIRTVRGAGYALDDRFAKVEP